MLVTITGTWELFFLGGEGGGGGQMSTSCCTTFTHNQGGNTIHLLFQVSWLNERSLTWV